MGILGLPTSNCQSSPLESRIHSLRNTEDRSVRVSGSLSMHHKEFIFKLSEWNDLNIYIYINIRLSFNRKKENYFKLGGKQISKLLNPL